MFVSPLQSFGYSLVVVYVPTSIQHLRPGNRQKRFETAFLCCDVAPHQTGCFLADGPPFRLSLGSEKPQLGPSMLILTVCLSVCKTPCGHSRRMTLPNVWCYM